MKADERIISLAHHLSLLVTRGDAAALTANQITITVRTLSGMGIENFALFSVLLSQCEATFSTIPPNHYSFLLKAFSNMKELDSTVFKGMIVNKLIGTRLDDINPTSLFISCKCILRYQRGIDRSSEDYMAVQRAVKFYDTDRISRLRPNEVRDLAMLVSRVLPETEMEEQMHAIGSFVILGD